MCYSNKRNSLRIGIYGYGKSTHSVLALLDEEKINYKLTYRSDNDDIPHLYNIERVFTKGNALSEINEDILFLSPSVRRDKTEFTEAIKKGVIISSDADIFSQYTKQRMFAVTGSDGKSSTTELINSILNHSGKRALSCGNCGVPFTSVMKEDAIVVAELSSFQLMYTEFSPERALITNITPNHLNWHKDFSEYANSKITLFKNARFRTIDADCDTTRTLSNNYKINSCATLKYNFDEITKIIKADYYLTRKNDIILLNGEHLFTYRNAKRQEEYNIKNFMLAAATLINEVSADDIESVISDFSGLPHRAEKFFTNEKISYINSSIDSTPTRTLSTLKSIENKPIALIICGVGKGLDLSEFIKELPSLTKGAVLFGQFGEEVGELLKKMHKDYKFVFVSDMKEAIDAAENILGDEGYVLLSPAATSFDMYKNFEERGNDFKNIVLNKYKIRKLK